jgi:cbb3-type cytochrome oxidase cytochrome c subunit
VEKLRSVLIFAGVGCFGLAWLASGWLPLKHLSHVKYRSLEEVVTEPSADFIDLSRRYPAEFKKAFGEPTAAAYRDALRFARDTYIAEACWHCHSQFVRPGSNVDTRFGKVSWAAEYMNEMFLPHLFGTRRVGPDLIRVGGKYGNDWHLAHFYDPTSVVPTSVMPRFTWFYDGDRPGKRALAMTAYMQWLGSWSPPAAAKKEEHANAH